MLGISLMFTIVGLVSFDLSVKEIKNLLGSRNEGFAFSMIQGLDKHIESRILAYKELTNLDTIQIALNDSNRKHERFLQIQSKSNTSEQQIETIRASPFIVEESQRVLTEELLDTIEFYHDEYNYDVIEELFVINAYGTNVALTSGTSTFSQSEEEWWKITKETGLYIGDIDFNEQENHHTMNFAYRIDNKSGEFIGVLHVLITLDDLLSDFKEESDVITIPGRNVLLIDERGYSIYSNKSIRLSDSPIPYFNIISQGKDVEFFELDDIDDFKLISYAKSTGYRTFEGFNWTVIIVQDSSSIVEEFNELRNSIFTISIIGILASIIGGFLISTTVSAPLRHLTKIANTISKGDFTINTKKSRIDEIKTISNSFEEMVINLKKLIETEKQLAEAHVKIRNERLTAIGELAASMAHDMKNPLSTIKTSSEILQKKTEQSAETKEVSNRMNRAIDRMSHQIDDVLNYVRITPLKLDTIKINELMNTAKKSLEISDNIVILIPESDIQIKGDLRKLEIVFINIFLNAIQAIGKNKGRIECKIEQKGTNVIIEIQDSGPGIQGDVFSKIFDSLVTTKQQGTGLGLSTCKNVIEQHHGTITAQNNPTRFVITLPLESE
ncbi:MAG: sensor histidine kinase [Nitrosopumilus sp.]|nr:sensor histidine kinase [Nitrosopumilus sp.]MDH3516111.1 sensor histidine kinase [Nitrosopumilus sp.]MDH3564598.1 sensor histidine kinase [Nitrosopumilus sp.]MDH5416815.1 sensor histidine kinase [Nitrosopumilus sp.]MDH5554659.1 sensor histidine kinase [Nitrosopumilus sp.]